MPLLIIFCIMELEALGLCSGILFSFFFFWFFCLLIVIDSLIVCFIQVIHHYLLKGVCERNIYSFPYHKWMVLVFVDNLKLYLKKKTSPKHAVT